MNRLWRLAILVMLLAAGRVPVRGADTPSWELSPYRVQLVVAVEPGLPLAPDLAANLPAQLAAQFGAALGAAARVEMQPPAPELRVAMLSDLAAVTAADLPAEALAGDKVLFLAIVAGDGGFRAQARELDVTTGIWNAVVTKEVAQAQTLVASSARALLAAFAPLARIESAEGGVAMLKLRGGALVRSGGGLPVGAGTVFRPLLLSSDSRGNVQPGSATPVAWTYLSATSASGGEATCRVDTGLAGNAIPAYHSQRPRWAIAVAPPSGATRLKLVTAGGSNVPLEGCDVLAQPAGVPGGASWQRIGMSNARGIVSVPASSAVVQMLLIRQGERPLARVPIVAGLADEASLALQDDSQRIELAQSLAELHDEMVDLAARREAIVARAKLAKTVGETAAVDKFKTQLGSLPGTEGITARLDQAAAGVKAAEATTQTALQPQIDALKKALDVLAAQKPVEQLEDPKPVDEKPDDTKAGTTTTPP